jgi:hypothetical protein
MTVEQNGQQVPLRDVPFIKESTDIGTFAKRAFDVHRELGSRIPLKVNGTAEVESWRKEHLPKLYQAGVLTAPPGKPEEYGITKPSDLPEGLGWSDELSKELATALHKHGVPKAAVPELLALHTKAMLGAQTALKTSYDEGMAALKHEHGDKFEERLEQAKRITGHFTKEGQWVPGLIFKTPEEVDFIEKTGLGDHPGFLSIIMRLAPLAMQDSSYLAEMTRPDGAMGGEALRTEIGKIMSDPTHPKYKLYWQRDPGVLKEIEEMYRKTYGDAKVELSGGLTAGGPAT